ncbi:hypothetical protein C2S04_02235 [Helicobacter pylori]|nr:hypothetical protein C2S04_02235 [Helicobacter pylori]
MGLQCEGGTSEKFEKILSVAHVRVRACACAYYDTLTCRSVVIGQKIEFFLEGDQGGFAPLASYFVLQNICLPQ